MSHKQIVGQQQSMGDFELESVPTEQRRAWWFIATIWLAIGIDISGLFLGAFLSEGLTLSEALVCVAIGSSILAVISTLSANVGFSSGLSTVLICSNVFGRLGGKMIGLIAGVSLVGWFAFQLDFFTAVTTSALESMSWSAPRIIVILTGSMLMTLTALWGVRALGKLSLLSVPVLLTLIGIALYRVVTGEGSLSDNIIAPIGYGSAISYVVSIWILGAVNAPDVARYARTRKDAVLGAALGFLVGNSFIIVVALVLTKYVGNDDLVAVFFALGMGLSAILVLVLAQWTTNTMNLIAGALDLAVAFPKVQRLWLMLAISLVGTGLAFVGMIENFATFLSFLGTLVSPIAGVYLLDYYWVSRGQAFTVQRANALAYNKAALTAWLVGVLICFMTSYDFLALFSLSEISVLDGTLAAALSYALLHRFLPSPQREVAQ